MDTPIIITDAIRTQVDEAFVGFVGNDDAVYAIKRALKIALAKDPPELNRTFLLTGPASTGKSETARRMTKCLGFPFVQIDGKNLRSRELLVGMMDDALGQKRPMSCGERGRMPVLKYPPMCIYTEEAHSISPAVQQTLLTMLEQADRTAVIDMRGERKVVDMQMVAFVMATTQPNRMDRPLRSRCTEIVFRRYSEDEVAQMVVRKFNNHLPEQIARKIAKASRCTPRIAFDIARDTLDEILDSTDGDMRTAFLKVAKGRGIVSNDGLTHTDMAYMRLLYNEKKPVGITVIHAMLYDTPSDIIDEDIEPYLIGRGYVGITDKGRILTWQGKEVLKQLEGK